MLSTSKPCEVDQISETVGLKKSVWINSEVRKMVNAHRQAEISYCLDAVLLFVEFSWWLIVCREQRIV